MRDIDFLPESYRQTRRRREARVLRTWLAGLILCVLGIWFFVGSNRLREARAQLAHLDAQNNTVQGGLTLIDQLVSREEELLERYKLSQELSPSLKCSRILQKLADLVPPQVVIERLHIRSTKVQTPSGNANKVSSLAARIAARDVPSPDDHRQITELNLTLSGLAPTEMDVAVLVGQLAGCQDFRNVRLEYCKAATFEQRQACRFQATFTIHPQASNPLEPREHGAK